MLKVNTVLHTCGDGLWSKAKKHIAITKLAVPYIDDDEDFGELRVYFSTRTWDVDTDGLIYTDSLFVDELRAFLGNIGLDGSDADYSEQGMQGDDYVSLDVGGAFLKSWLDKING